MCVRRDGPSGTAPRPAPSPHWMGVPRGGFTRQSVKVARLEALTKVRAVRSPVRNRQRPVRGGGTLKVESNHGCTPIDTDSTGGRENRGIHEFYEFSGID